MFTTLCKTGLIVALAIILPTTVANAESPEAMFHQAYYLEHAEHDTAAAAALYERVSQARQLDPTLRRRAETGLANCREDLACADLAKLMPADAFAYVELSSPGKQIKKLLDHLGILASGNAMPEGSENRVAVSPALIDAVLGIRGVAVAITEFDMQRHEPKGVVVIHPGDISVIRGLVETILPIAARRVQPVGGFPTYFIDEEVYATLTHRLVVLSGDRGSIADVIDRLNGKVSDSLADSDAFSEFAKKRDNSLVSFFIDTKPILEDIETLLNEAATRDHGVLMIRTLLDPTSIEALTGHLGVHDDGITAQVELRLNEGHHNLIYNLVRTTPVDRQALLGIPKGAAGFVVAGLNDLSSRYNAADEEHDGERPVVTGLDIGREFFANIATVSICAMTPEAPADSRHSPIPDIALSIRVNDPRKSELLWKQVLGVASLASGAPAVEGEVSTIAGQSVTSYRLNDSLRLYLATTGNRVTIATTQSAARRSIEAQSESASVLADDKFSAGLNRIDRHTTKAVFLHAGRCAEVAKQFMNPREWSEMAPFVDLLDDTVASLVIDHSNERFRVTAEMNGIPNIADLLSKMISAEHGRNHRHAADSRVNTLSTAMTKMPTERN